MKWSAQLRYFLLLPSLVLQNDLNGAEYDRTSYLPIPVEISDCESLHSHSPFTRTLFLSESLILTGIANVNGEPVATLMDTEAAESIAVSQLPSEDGWRLISLSGTEDIEVSVATIQAGSGETIKVRYDKDRMKSASQRIAQAARARGQRVVSQSRVQPGNSNAGGIPPERIKTLQSIDKRKLPEAYNPGAGKNREEAHTLHQTYVDRRLSGMSPRQKSLVGTMWQQQQQVQPNMQNRGASFVRILEHVAENER